jgi:tetratricopeptide (TPR) repeat protein
MISGSKLILLNLILLICVLNCSPYSLAKNKYSYRDKNAFEFYLKSVDYFFNGEYQQALESIAQAIDLNKSFAQFHKLKGDIHFNINEDEQALISYKNAVKYRSDFTEVYLTMGEIYKRNNNYEDAVMAYNKVLFSDQKQLDSYLELAKCYLALGNSTMSFVSLEEYKKVINEFKRQPAPDYHFLLGKTYFILKRYNDAIMELQKIKEPLDEKVYCLLGRCYYGLEEYDTGLQYFNKLLNMNNDVGEYYYYRGIYFYNKNDYEDAMTQFKLALELDNSQRDAHYYLHKIYESIGNKEEALKQYQLYNSDLPQTGE